MQALSLRMTSFSSHRDNSWLGPLRFGSCPRPVRPVPELHGSVRFGRFGSVSVSYSLLTKIIAACAASFSNGTARLGPYLCDVARGKKQCAGVGSLPSVSVSVSVSLCKHLTLECYRSVL